MTSASVDVYLVNPASLSRRSIDQVMQQLPPEERARILQMVFQRDRDLSALAHAMTRVALCRRLACVEQELLIERTSEGRPYVRHPRNSELSFSLSHTRGLAAMAISGDGTVGLDVEQLDQSLDPSTLGPSVLSEQERQWLAMESEADQLRRFVRLWVLKESYLKARGIGLSLEPSLVSFDTRNSQVRFTPPADDTRSWAFHVDEPTPEHLLAVCVEASDIRLQLHDGRSLLGGC